jgi:D-amino-acid dehydrogenase
MSAGYCRNGILSLYLTRERLEAAAADDQPMADTGEHASLLEAAEVRTRVPAVRPDVAGGLLTPQDAHVDPMAVTRELARLATDRGAVVLTGTEALDFAVSGDRVSAVRTTRGVFHAGTVVLAAGVWTAPLARLLHLWLPLQPAKGYSVSVARPQGVPDDTPLYLPEGHVCVTPFGDRLRIAGTLELSGFSTKNLPKRITGIRRGAGRFLQGVGEAEPLHIWRGLRPLTPDGLPFVGRSSQHTNLVVATGHNMSGILWGPITGKLVTEIVNDQPPSVDLQPLRLQRLIR